MDFLCIISLIVVINGDKATNEHRYDLDEVERLLMMRDSGEMRREEFGNLTEAESASLEVTQTLSTILKDYDKKIRPNYRGQADIVQIGIAVLSIGSISEKTMEFSLHCYFRQFWKDLRLQFLSENHTNLPLNAQTVLNEIWHPDTYIRNGKKSFIHKLTVPNILLRLGSDGSILLSQRLTIRARCLMRLSKFPMDRQECQLEIGSCYNSEELQYSWTGIEVDLTQELSQFRLGKVMTKSNLSVVSTQINMNSSIISAHFFLIREKGYYILQIYLPTSMIVAMSWVSFWINKEAAIARCSLGVTTVLTLTTLRLGVKEELPVVHYSTALDVFLFVAFGFVLGALVEFVMIHSAYLGLLRAMIDQTKMMGKKRRNTRNRSISFGFLDEKSPISLRRIHSFAKQRLTQVYRKTSSSLYKVRSPPVTFSTTDELKLAATRTLSDMSLSDVGSRLATMTTPSVDNIEILKLQDETCRNLGSANEDDETKLEYLDTESIQYIDRYAKIMFPMLFFLFHVIYWTSYSYLMEDEAA